MGPRNGFNPDLDHLSELETLGGHLVWQILVNLFGRYHVLQTDNLGRLGEVWQ